MRALSAHGFCIMNKKTILLLAMLCGLLASCFKDDEVTLNNYCYIKNVSLGNIKRWKWTTDSLGKPVRQVTTYSGKSFQMTIDQRTETIENRDSLLFNTDLSALLVTIGFDGATVVYRAADDSTAEWQAYNSKDSMDLRKPVHLMVVANDGSSTRRYTMKVNVHQQEGDSLYWNRTDSAVVALENMSDPRAVVQAGKLCVLGHVGENVCVALRSTTVKEGQWEQKVTDLPQTALVETVCQMGGNIYVGTADGDLYRSADAQSWSRVGSMGQNVRLAGAGKSFLYALAGQNLMRSGDGLIWEQETIDEDASYLPDTCVNLIAFEEEDGDSRVVMVGYRSQENDTTAMVWNKTWSAREKEDRVEWIFFNHTVENKWLCPRLKSLNVMPYDGKCLAFGGASDYEGGKYKALGAMFFSRDCGITWKPDYELHLPKALLGVSGPIASAVDSDKYIWIIANREVWRGRLNRLGFLRQ